MPQQKLELANSPQTPVQANQLSIDLNMKYGSEGWNLVGVVPIRNGAALLFAFEKPD